jgi:hypothetical protein
MNLQDFSGLLSFEDAPYLADLLEENNDPRHELIRLYHASIELKTFNPVNAYQRRIVKGTRYKPALIKYGLYIKSNFTSIGKLLSISMLNKYLLLEGTLSLCEEKDKEVLLQDIYDLYLVKCNLVGKQKIQKTEPRLRTQKKNGLTHIYKDGRLFRYYHFIEGFRQFTHYFKFVLYAKKWVEYLNYNVSLYHNWVKNQTQFPALRYLKKYEYITGEASI